MSMPITPARKLDSERKSRPRNGFAADCKAIADRQWARRFAIREFHTARPLILDHYRYDNDSMTPGPNSNPILYF